MDTHAVAMDNSIPSLLLVLGIKSLLNWTVVLGQRQHMVRSFLGSFCISLALVDSLLTLAVSAIYGLEDFRLLGLRFTRYHICLLVQIACFTYGLLHWPVFFLAGLDHYWTLWPGRHPLRWTRRLAYAWAACAVWAATLFYVFAASGFRPDTGEGSHLLLRRCLVFPSPQSTQVSSVLLLTVGCTLLYCSLGPLLPDGPRAGGPLSWHVLCLTIEPFLSTWAPFVIFQMALLLVWADVPAYLDMNVPWLCFLNSFLVGALSWKRFGAFRLGRTSSLTDGFCDWHFSSDSAGANSSGGGKAPNTSKTPALDESWLTL
ncbi:probable G-protein coupled receptor 160 [Megalops cyprinoides]|uniref:probable G-protein coupled receptor 160 n=1 Tax=Megalops cyprinoides TaxID=118141 RepID=UPI00186505B6|nr:probable G-protein coupled receptor 160 [Megalops cyprinoides]XP_036410520.1 probable G-protein coupled receptor 160 [Megalops cyprinoides]